MDETNNVLEKLTTERSISPIYSCLTMSEYCLSQIALQYKNDEKKVPKALEKFLTETFPKLVADYEKKMEEQHLMLNTSGSA
jgi:hypothetical protein